jgi:hypothetical protein
MPVGGRDDTPESVVTGRRDLPQVIIDCGLGDGTQPTLPRNTDEPSADGNEG